MKIIIFAAFISFMLPSANLFAAAAFKTGTHALVDGVYNSTQTVITSRQPLISWEYEGKVSSFTVVVSSDNVFSSTGELWNYYGTTNTLNTINFITRVTYGADGAAAVLEADKTYFLEVSIYDGNTVSDSSQFTAVSAAADLPGSKFDLTVDWNNPFNPSKSQFTKFRFLAKDRDRKLQLRIYTISGELVSEWPEQTALKDAVYTETWNGRNSNNETVARGIYLISLIDVGEKTGVTRKVAVINGNQ